MSYITQKEVVKIPGWERQLAGLVKTVWSTEDGIFLFPYPPFGDSAYWEKEVLSKWREGKMFSWLAVEDGIIRAHASLINKGDHWELGRFVSYDDNPRFTMKTLCSMAMTEANKNGWRVVCEATQRHTSSQYICSQVGLRFAGIGFLSKIDSVYWDIIYYDNLKEPVFKGELGITANPLGNPLACNDAMKDRLRMIKGILSTERHSGFPPKLFHTLPENLSAIEDIILINVCHPVAFLGC